MLSVTRQHKGTYQGTTTWFLEFGGVSDFPHIAGTTQIFGWSITLVIPNRGHVRRFVERRFARLIDS